MADKIRPRPRPCASCPYRRDVPSGVWAAEEYDKLPVYDLSTTEQAKAGAFGVFMCHQADGFLCSGWIAVHDMDENLAIRMDPDVDQAAVRAYTTDVPVFSSGAEAAAHGKAEVENPGPGSFTVMAKIATARALRGKPVNTGEEGGKMLSLKARIRIAASVKKCMTSYQTWNRRDYRDEPEALEHMRVALLVAHYDLSRLQDDVAAQIVRRDTDAARARVAAEIYVKGGRAGVPDQPAGDAG